jgi:ABC-type branched-subunit amino acid transport system substrate-binding protein
VLFVPGSFSDATLIAAQAVKVGLHVTMLGGDAWSSPLLFQRGGPPGDAYYAELCSPTPWFDRVYERAEGQEPPGCRAVLAYDAVKVIAAGLKSLGPLPDEALDASLVGTRRRLRDAVARNVVMGATGRIRFDPQGDRRQGVALYSVEKTARGPYALVQGWLGLR